jgi:hypothetical protein
VNAIQTTSGAGAKAAQLKAWADSKGSAVKDSLFETGRKVIGRAIRFTPHQGGKKAMEDVVARDVRRAIRPITPEAFFSPRLRALAEAGDLKGLNEAIAQTPRQLVGAKVDGKVIAIKEVRPFSPWMHRRARDGRGRVSGGMSRRLGAATLNGDAVEKYVQKKKRNVGMGRAGWAPAMTGLQGSVSAYIRRHQGQGAFEDKSRDPVRAFVRSRNFSPWAGDGEEAKRVIGGAMRSGGRDIAEGITRRMRGRLDIAMKGVTK